MRLDAIGDFVIWLDTAKKFKELYPDQNIVLIANSLWSELAAGLPYWNEVISVDPGSLKFNRPFRRWSTLRRINKRGFGIAIHPTFSRSLMLGDSIVRATSAPLRIGSVGDFANATPLDKAIGNRWYTRLYPAEPGQMMELLRNAEFFSQLSNAPHAPNLPNLPKLLSRPAVLSNEIPYYVIFPGASWAGRQWPPERFAELILIMSTRQGWRPILCGSEGERSLGHDISRRVDMACINLAGRTDLGQLVETIRGAELLVSNETSAIHIAAAVQTPAVCILGGGHFGRFMPYPEQLKRLTPAIAAEPAQCFNCNWMCTQPHDPNRAAPCINNVSVDTVVKAIDQTLQIASLVRGLPSAQP